MGNAKCVVELAGCDSSFLCLLVHFVQQTAFHYALILTSLNYVFSIHTSIIHNV